MEWTLILGLGGTQGLFLRYTTNLNPETLLITLHLVPAVVSAFNPSMYRTISSFRILPSLPVPGTSVSAI